MTEPRSLLSLLPGWVVAPPGAGEIMISGLALDSRKVRPGDLFAALPGAKADGRQFIASAESAGAAAILAVPGTLASLPVVAAADPREALAAIAAAFHPRQPDMIAAVTGTNGKSSTVEFLRQIWGHAGHEAAALGTLGVTRSSGRTEVGYTTPDAIALHAALDALAGEGVTHVAMEASSHGLKQRRMDEARVSVGGFTNLTQDHLDYHPDFEDYFEAKMRLFEVLLEPGAKAVINVDSDWGEQVARRAQVRGLKVSTVGWRGEDIQIKEITPRAASQLVRFVFEGEERQTELPLMGEFQASNAFQAAGMAIASGVGAETAFAALETLDGVPGRLELAGTTQAGSPVLIDYAHTPDGLDKLLRAARPHTRGRIAVVFGAGGDRDPSKREKMGAVAAKLADRIYVTDDNPRSEKPEAIRAEILKGCPQATEIGDRAEAIRTAVAALEPGDTLLIAGKGHETGQIVGDTVIPFDDREQAKQALEREGARR
ncbi:UDP-N-acetylmuramoyl-L-alanyl-D-glutamate--2,6-diaminopimelate ligase [Glycocaulis profundi]|nr:UDP-N-acetylmuramoyl-L-alanyl-D-glutamate--2,6-diaminopimelate ligase [Glycocaulis profundi]